MRNPAASKPQMDGSMIEYSGHKLRFLDLLSSAGYRLRIWACRT
jgi:hypothetical protein